MRIEPAPRFRGLSEECFGIFADLDRVRRRRRILDVVHPALETLAVELLVRLGTEGATPLRPHLPRLDWPRGYQPFCTWLALSRASHGYQTGPQLNLGVHADHVAIRLGWDASANAFGRFEFLARFGELGRELGDVAAREGLQFRVYASAPWPRGSALIFESAQDRPGSFDAVRTRGVWWEIGRRYELATDRTMIGSPVLGDEAARIFAALLPAYDRFVGDPA